ncbi:hypothetical protein [Streptomyces sp. NBC_00996]|uniref:hypothetical protein n=1 Tax=Streptomyces sp. NBC_00996 TaxID=2903710 RepID=UPI003863FEFB
MNSRGVVEVIVAMTGLRLGVLNTETYTIVVLVAIATSLMAPPILRYAMAHVEETAGTMLGMDTLTVAPDGAPDHGPDAVRTFERRGDT